MTAVLRHSLLRCPLLLATVVIGFLGCSARPAPKAQPAAERPAAPVTTLPAVPVHPVMLGIDVLEASGFNAVSGKTVGLLTHAAGVNRRGESTINVLRRAPNTRLVALFSPEHSLYSDEPASKNVEDFRDPRSGLPVYSLHGKNRRPTPAQLKGLDALVIDLQDIGVRSYTYAVTMRYTLEACFQAGVEVVLLDRPNPLGGLKVDGPHLDREWMSGVGAFRIPYVHGLTMGELARMAANAPGVLEIPDEVRRRGRLTIVPMRGWRRSMRWPETGLTFVPTSPMIRDFSAVVGYAMVGLGCEYSGFKHGIGKDHPFRAITFRGKKPEQIIADLEALQLPGLSFRKLTTADAQGRTLQAVYVQVSDWNAWNPTELSFELMRLACRYDPPNPFAKLDAKKMRSFNIHVGSTAWWRALSADGAAVDLDRFKAVWHGQNEIYRQQTSRHWWIYAP